MPYLSIGTSKPRKAKVFSSATMWTEGTDHSHIFITFKDPRTGLRYIAEARGGGIRMLSNIKFKQENLIVNIYRYECTQEQIDEVEKFIWESLAHDYGYKHIIGLAAMRLENMWYRFIRSNKKAANKFKDGKYSQICCEMGLRALEILGYDIPGNVEDYGLKETEVINESLGKKRSKEKIDHINDLSRYSL